MKIDLPELERKLSYGINLTIKESTILLESMQSFIDDKMELQEQLNTAKKALTEIDCSRYGMQFRRDRNPNIARQALAAIGGDDD
ncbi:hypothetical protein [Lactococcus lactis]|uniref:hypothetical protein n=1 Tax=Lactococcus lactis TaxID=1358 RepID=UPI003D10636D